MTTHDKDAVMPLVGEVTGTFDDGRVYARLQRDADWLVLQPYMAKATNLAVAAQEAWRRGKEVFDELLGRDGMRLEPDECWTEFEALWQALEEWHDMD